jgi:hypothetical protein
MKILLGSHQVNDTARIGEKGVGGTDDFLDCLKEQFMYSYEDRLRAVRLYIKLGRRAGLTIRQLGYPTKNALKAWHSEFEQRQGLSTGYTRQPKYTTAHREQAGQQ